MPSEIYVRAKCMHLVNNKLHNASAAEIHKIRQSEEWQASSTRRIRELNYTYLYIYIVNEFIGVACLKRLTVFWERIYAVTVSWDNQNILLGNSIAFDIPDMEGDKYIAHNLTIALWPLATTTTTSAARRCNKSYAACYRVCTIARPIKLCKDFHHNQRQQNTLTKHTSS